MLLSDFRTTEFEFNVPQAIINTVMANETWALWGRGTGKTAGAIATWILQKVEAMPRSSGGLVGRSFTDVENKILKPIFTAFSMFGLERGVDYEYGKRPPSDWEQPYIPIIDYSHVLSFPNGTTCEIISLAIKASANALSLQWIVGDEAKFLNPKQLREEVFPILRGNSQHFGDSPWYGAKLFVTDKLHSNIQWILDKRKLMDKTRIDTIIQLQLQVNAWRMKMANVERRQAAEYARQIKRHERFLAHLRKSCVHVSEASSYDNIKNLKQSYFDNMKRTLTAYEFSIAIKNEDPTRVENGYYPNRTEANTYDLECDDDTTRPLAIAMDWQYSITPIVVAQKNDRVLGVTSLNFLNVFYVKYPLGIRDAVRSFCDFYRDRQCKELIFYYDHTAVGKRNGQKKFYEEAQEYFEEEGWTVTLEYIGAAPAQDDKYRRLNVFLKEGVPMPVMINSRRCASLLLAMDLTGTIAKGESFGKDKTKEKDFNVPQELTTHIPDAFDTLLWAVCEMDRYPEFMYETDVIYWRS